MIIIWPLKYPRCGPWLYGTYGHRWGLLSASDLPKYFVNITQNNNEYECSVLFYYYVKYNGTNNTI